MILDTWHLAHDLKDQLLVQHGLKTDPRVISDQHRTFWDKLLASDDFK
jgi:hypothetical protein